MFIVVNTLVSSFFELTNFQTCHPKDETNNRNKHNIVKINDYLYSKQLFDDN